MQSYLVSYIQNITTDIFLKTLANVDQTQKPRCEVKVKATGDGTISGASVQSLAIQQNPKVGRVCTGT